MICAIVAVDKNYGIGYKNNLLYKYKPDLEHFKKITSGGTVIMGRKTYESIGHPLINRQNIVLTRYVKKYNSDYDNLQYTDYYGIAKLLEDKQYTDDRKIFLIGGEKVYFGLLEYCMDIYLTVFNTSFKKVDAYFPNITELGYSPVEHIHTGMSDDGFLVTIDRYTKGIEKCKYW